MALTEAVKEMVWLWRLLIELGSQTVVSTCLDITNHHFFSISNKWEPPTARDSTPMTKPALTSAELQLIYADNQGAIKLSENVQFHKRTKHIDIRYYFIRTAHEWEEP